MARNAEDAALLLDAMIGDDAGLTPISAIPPWKGAAAAVAETRDLKQMRIGMPQISQELASILKSARRAE
jgi:Asp-tRNA(Asn)/Glu-tRNA(Gln) amidotransferase A subunit family amidase